jgi:hypothetical protein
MQNIIDIVIQRGWKVFPLIPRSRFASEQPLLSQATSSFEQIEEWQKQFLDCPWALATGEHSGVFVVECTLDLGIQTLRAHCDTAFTPMDTLHLLTAKRLAMFFRWPDSGLPASRRAMLAQGVYIRKSGGYIELPLAGDDSYDEYAFSDPNASINDAPSWLLHLIYAGFSKQGPAEVTPFPVSCRFSRLVGLSFSLLNDRWVCDFFSMNDAEMIIKTLYFRSSKTILALAERGGIAMNEANKEWLYRSVDSGKGYILLTLNREQYEKLLAA